jgi:3-hydroxyacyl-CoA dehydrogenase/enoyl-CoA hydratase/3-hydroxybutyryl-CoA epimerase
VIGTFINEGLAMLAEGVPAPSIEQASSQAGYPAPVLQLSDELNLKLMRKIRVATEAAIQAEGGSLPAHPAYTVIDRMLDEFDRPGRLEGKGFYAYEDGKRTGLWSGLAEAFGGTNAEIPFEDLKERMMFVEALETVKCVDEGVIESIADANIGSIFGIGFPAWTGGVLQYINGYDGGLQGFVARARELAATYGDRFEPPASLVERAERGEVYTDEQTLVASS